MNTKTVFLKLNCFHVAQIPYGQDSSQNLPCDGCHCSAHHSPFEDKDEYWIQDNVGKCTCQCGDHSEFGTSIGTNNGIHGLTEHIERNTYRNPEEVFSGLAESFFIDTSTEHGQDRFPKDKIYSSQDDTTDDA